MAKAKELQIKKRGRAVWPVDVLEDLIMQSLEKKSHGEKEDGEEQRKASKNVKNGK